MIRPKPRGANRSETESLTPPHDPSIRLLPCRAQVVAAAAVPDSLLTPCPRAAVSSMDIRRAPPRSSSGGVEPRFRQVGFVTSAGEPSGAAAAADEAPAASPTPSELSPGPLSPRHDPAPARPRPPARSRPPSSRPRLGRALLPATAFVVARRRGLRHGGRRRRLLGAATSPRTARTNQERSYRNKNEVAPTSVPQKPKLSKAERRAVQEAQRAAKAAAKEAGLSRKSKDMASGAGASMSKQPKTAKTPLKKDVTTQKNPPYASDKRTGERHHDRDRMKDAPQPRMQLDDVPRVEKSKRRSVVNQSGTQKRVELFRHLPQHMPATLLPDLESKILLLDAIHPSVYKVGLQYLSGTISGGNARCIAMLLAFREAINDYSTPAEKTLDRDLPAKISSYVSFLVECRPLSISMGNAIRFLKNSIAKLPLTLSESEAKVSLQSDIDRFIHGNIITADKVIVSHAVTKIRDDDVLLTYGSPSVVEMIFNHAHDLGKKFRVVVVDSRPNLEGQRLLHRLVAKGISCTYTHINAVSYIMHEVTRVFLGASSVLSNGTVYSRVGTASIAMVAHAFEVPVLVCCEAYKFHERVQLDSICFNELGDPDAISRVPGRENLSLIKNWADVEDLQVLNLKYDITPSDYVSMLITEYGMLWDIFKLVVALPLVAMYLRQDLELDQHG
ncbi:hypothetical protein PR202_ga11831 [Eleusine coracana subsp. coracana]|uniref:Translation initiation factor eIF2B subunit delta n=1 Tax=Eleusine coracana subsp. coracana TaxID=191504 RepID=A0AAV5C9Y6_ELECO|nr:hypothetical protein PR202_ga11831 [Eleusine coracana subsp. coracana]